MRRRKVRESKIGGHPESQVSEIFITPNHQRFWNRVERSVRRAVSLIPIWQIISVRSVEWLCSKRMSKKLHNRRLESKRETIKDN